MRKKKIWRYYCEYCKKSGCSSYYIKRHEESCTLNPDRKCRFCKVLEIEQQPITKLIVALGEDFKDTDSDVVRKDRIYNLHDTADGCPACMLAATRQGNGIPQFYFINHFSYKEESDLMWEELNRRDDEFSN